MEDHTHNIRFILSCNYSSQIIDALQSRCRVHRFTPVNDEAVRERIVEIGEMEGMDLSDEALDAVVHASNGDLRSAINSLQALSAIDKEDPVTRDDVYDRISVIRPERVEDLVLTAEDGQFTEARELLQTLLYKEGLSSGDIIQQVHRQVWDLGLSDDKAITVIDSLGEAEYRITEGCSDKLQLEAFLAEIAN
jgi:replication factor C small subunit